MKLNQMNRKNSNPPIKLQSHTPEPQFHTYIILLFVFFGKILLGFLKRKGFSGKKKFR